MRRTRAIKQGEIKARLKRLSELRGFTDPKIDVEALLYKHRSKFRTFEDYLEVVRDVKEIVDDAQEQAVLEREFHPREALPGVLAEKVWLECRLRRLKKGVTVSRKTKHDIALRVGLEPGSISSFKTGKSKAYHLITKVLSELGYHEPLR